MIKLISNVSLIVSMISDIQIIIFELKIPKRIILFLIDFSQILAKLILEIPWPYLLIKLVES
jgi:hypothetical protein